MCFDPHFSTVTTESPRIRVLLISLNCKSPSGLLICRTMMLYFSFAFGQHERAVAVKQRVKAQQALARGFQPSVFLDEHDEVILIAPVM